MAAGVIALILTVVGTLLVVTGVCLSLADRKKKIKEGKATLEPKNFAGETLKGLAKLAEALKDYPLGMQLIFVGVALMLGGGAVGGVSSL